MQYYYGEQNLLRALDEAAFWKHQEKEHTGLIPLVTPNLEAQYVHQLEQLGNEIGTTYAETLKYVTSITRSKGRVSRELKMQMANLIRQCIEQSKHFVALMTEMLKNSQAVHASPASQEVIHHMIRESQYFIGIDQLVLG